MHCFQGFWFRFASLTMSRHEQLGRLFDYDLWGCRAVLEVLEEHPSFPERPEAVGMFWHILNTRRFWYQRITSDGPDGVELWPDRAALEGAEEGLEEVHRTWVKLLEREANLDRPVSYETTDGRACEDRLGDLMHHLIIHGQHHRAQIAKMVRRGGIDPPETDFIFYLREQVGRS